MYGKPDFLDYEPLKRPSRSGASPSHPDDSDSNPPNPPPTNEFRYPGGADGLAASEPLVLSDAPQRAATTPNEDARKIWLKRGHLITYAGLYLFTVMLFFRPYELFPPLAFLSTSTFWIAVATLAVFIPTQLALENRLTARPREVNLVLLLVVTALLSIPGAIRPSEAWNTFTDPFLKAVVIFIVMVNVIRTYRRLNLLMLLSIFVGVVLSFGAIYDYRSGKLTIEGYRAAGLIGNLFGNPNDMAIHLSMMVPLAIGCALASRKIINKILLGLSSALLAIGTVLTYSRGGFLGLVVVIAGLGWKLGRRNRAIVLILCAVFLVGGLLVSPGNYLLRILSIFDHSLDPVASASNRQDILMRSLLVAARHPLFGVGMGNFHIMSIHELVNHNSYLQVATELGLTATVLYVLFQIAPLRRLGRIDKETYDDRRNSRIYYIAVGLQVSMLSYMVTSFFGSVAYLWYVYYLVGYIVCLDRIYRSERGPVTSNT